MGISYTFLGNPERRQLQEYLQIKMALKNLTLVNDSCAGSDVSH